jgi:hypothetical protein
VRLAALPRVGDVIDFYPLDLAKAGEAARRGYVVLSVSHEIYAATDSHPAGHHHVTIEVRPLTI